MSNEKQSPEGAMIPPEQREPEGDVGLHRRVSPEVAKEALKITETLKRPRRFS